MDFPQQTVGTKGQIPSRGRDNVTAVEELSRAARRTDKRDTEAR